MATPRINQRHIAFVSLLETGEWGASEYLWSQTATNLRQRGHRVTACTHGWSSRPSPLEALHAQGVGLIERSPPVAGRWRDFIRGMRDHSRPPLMHLQAIARLAKLRPDLVLLSAPWVIGHNLSGWAEELHARGIRYAILIHTHAGHVWPTGYLAERLSKVLNQAAAVYCVSADNRDLLESQLSLRARLVQVVRNPLAVMRDYAPIWPDESPTRIACVGRLDPAQKGQDLLLHCLTNPAWRERACKVGFFGEGPGRPQLEHLAKGLPDGMVTFHGHAADPAEIWRSHHLLAFPSRYEGLGLAVAEAQSCGRPVVISDCAARELVVDGETGFIAAGTSARALDDALERAWRERARWAKLGEAARRHMLQLLPADPAADFATQLETV